MLERTLIGRDPYPHRFVAFDVPRMAQDERRQIGKSIETELHVRKSGAVLRMIIFFSDQAQTALGLGEVYLNPLKLKHLAEVARTILDNKGVPDLRGDEARKVVGSLPWFLTLAHDIANTIPPNDRNFDTAVDEVAKTQTWPPNFPTWRVL